MSERVVVRSATDGNGTARGGACGGASAEATGDDALVAVKLARDPEEAERLDREAAVLAAFRHPGVVRLVGHVPGAELLTARVGERDAARSPAGDLGQALARTAALAALVADLHDRGLVHGAISPDHVLLTPDGRPVLCSLHLAGPPGEPFPEPTQDPAFPAGTHRRPACDVYGVGTVLAHELAAAPTRPLTDRRTRRAADRLVRSATHAEPSRRPGAGAFAAALARLAGTDRATPSNDRRRPVDRRPAERRPRRPTALAPVVAAMLAILGAVVVVARGESGVPSSAAEPAPLPATTTTRSFPDPRPPTPVPAPTAPPDLPAAGEPAPAEPSGPPPELEHEGARYRVGEAGDRAAIGDWDCDGVPTVALLRPSTGAVFVFSGWADAGSTLDERERTRLPGATDLRAAPRLDGCDDLELTTPVGTRTVSLAPGGGA
jgi:hypothetical protein